MPVEIHLGSRGDIRPAWWESRKWFQLPMCGKWPPGWGMAGKLRQAALEGKLRRLRKRNYDGMCLKMGPKKNPMVYWLTIIGPMKLAIF